MYNVWNFEMLNKLKLLFHFLKDMIFLRDWKSEVMFEYSLRVSIKPKTPKTPKPQNPKTPWLDKGISVCSNKAKIHDN